jgi:ABC-type multidrug transport system fused ATPase/permease subunit
MLYVQQSLAPDEQLIYIAKFHWFYDVQAVMNIVWGAFFAVILMISFAALVPYLPDGFVDKILSAPLSIADTPLKIMMKLHPGIKLFALLIFLMGVFKFAQMLVIKVTTEIAVTNTRLIYKRGLVARSVGEMNVDRIESISVHQSFWGRIFNFGQLMVRGMGVGELIMPNLADPIRFRRAIEKARQI